MSLETSRARRDGSNVPEAAVGETEGSGRGRRGSAGEGVGGAAAGGGEGGDAAVRGEEEMGRAVRRRRREEADVGGAVREARRGGRGRAAAEEELGGGRGGVRLGELRAQLRRRGVEGGGGRLLEHGVLRPQVRPPRHRRHHHHAAGAGQW